MPILDLQKRARELGRIRLGTKNPETGAPQKLDKFRFTSNSDAVMAKIAELYGGTVRPWEGGTQKWEVISETTRVPIMVPPQPVTQWHEFWTRAGCIHRCDGRTNALTDEPCDPEEKVKVGQKTVNPHAEAMKKPTTRLNVVLRDVEGIGVWRVETHGWFAAIEIPDVAEFLAMAGGYVNGWLSLEQRTSIDTSGEKPITRNYMVPIIEVDVTPSQLMAGHGRVAAPALTGGPVGNTPALAAGGPDYVALAADVTDAEGIRDLWRQANGAGHMTQGLNDHLAKRAQELEIAAGDQPPVAPPVEPQPDADGAYEAELVPDADADQVWQQILVAAHEQHGWGLSEVTADFKTSMGMIPDEAAAPELSAYLHQLTTGEAVPA